MSCAHKRKRPVIRWVVERKGKVLTAVKEDTYTVYHCLACNAVGLDTQNEFVYSKGVLRGRRIL